MSASKVLNFEEEFYSEEYVANFLGLTDPSMKTARSKSRKGEKSHPPCIKIGQKMLYPKEEFQQWVKSQPRRGQAQKTELGAD